MSELTVVTTTPMQLLDIAVNKGADIEQLDKLLALQERWEANEARKLYSDSMVTVHEEMPTIAKTLRNDHTKSDYASLDMIINQTKKIYTHHGFSISFHEGDTLLENHVRICADVIHRSGHKETYHYDIPLDGTGIKGNSNMTAIHAKASSTSYARRYLMCMIFNIPTGDDTDGNMPGETLTEEHIREIETLASEVGVKTTDKAFLEYLKVESIDQVLDKYFKDVLSVLEQKR